MLEPSPDEIREWGDSVIQFMADYLGGLSDRPVYRHTSSREIRSRLDLNLPIKGTDFDSLLKIFRDTIVPYSRQNAHPRMFGYVQSPGTPIGAFADLLASTLNCQSHRSGVRRRRRWNSNGLTNRLDPSNSRIRP
jgi:hypothetical protein